MDRLAALASEGFVLVDGGEIRTRSVADGSVDRTMFAWLETWGRTPEGWRLRALASTRAPDAAR